MRSLTRLAWLRGILALALAAVPLAPLAMATPAMAATPARAAVPVVAAAPDDRGVLLPDDSGAVPAYRPTGAALLVCTGDAAAFTARISAFPAQLRTINSTLWAQCQKSGFHTVQAAVDAVKTPGQIIKILPGVYVETPSLAPTSTLCMTLPGPRDHDGALVLSFVQQSTCPHLENLVAVLSKKNLQIEGMGSTAGDVVIDGAYARRTVLRVDRSPGTYLRNFTVEHAIGTTVDVMETDGFAVDGLVARATGGDGVRANGDDHGLITDCVAYANGNAGIAVDSSRAPTSRYSVEVRRCQSRDNLLGYSGSAGNAVFAHDNRFTGNAIGVSMGSAADSPTAVGVPVGRPQHRAVFERNVIADNNRDDAAAVRDGTCAKPIAQRGYDQGVVCPAVTVPSGIGIMLRGGNDNTFDNNWIYGNHYAGFLATWLPGLERGSSAPHTQLETSHRNHVFANTWGRDTAGAAAPNGLDVWWDAQGVGTCWRVPASARTVPLALPNCTADGTPAGLGIARWVGDPMAALTDDVCTRVDPAAGVPPTDCPWYGAAGLARVDVKWALGEAVLLGLLVLWLWARVLRGRGAGAARLGLVLVLAGLGLEVYGTVRGDTLWPAAALGVMGVGWLCLGFPLRRRGRPGLGVITIGLGVFALLGALDQAVWMLPWIPVAPGVVRLALEIIWVPWAMAAAVSGRVLARARPSRDPLVRYAQALRA